MEGIAKIGYYDLNCTSGLSQIEDNNNINYSNIAIRGKINPKRDNMNCNGTIPDEGSTLKIETQKKCKIELYVKATSKTKYFVKDNAGTPQIIDTGSLETESGIKKEEYDLDADSIYYYYAVGSKVVFYYAIIEELGGQTPAHTHNFTYSAAGATLTATCSADGCGLTDKKVSLTLSASSANYSGNKSK